MGERDDYGNLLSDSLANVNTNTNSLFGDGYTKALPGDGSTAITAAADNSGNTSALTSNVLGSNNITAAADNSGNTAALTAADTSGFPTGITNLAGLKKFVNDNKALFGVAGAGLSMLSDSAGQKTGFQGGIPALTATRNMITAPPVGSNYRPGQGGINYGGDVTYSRTSGTDPWANLSGNSGVDLSGFNSAYNTANATYLSSDAAAKAAAAAAAKAAAQLAAAQAAKDAAAIAAATKAAADAAAAAKAAADKAAADKIASDAAKAAAAKAAKDAADKIAADKIAADKIAADKIAADKIPADKIAADAKALENWKKGLTPQQYLGAINQWIADNPNLSKADLDAAMTKFKVSQTDLQTALSQNKALSAADIYALTHGQGLKEANAMQGTNIAKWIADNPYATAKQIQDAIAGSGVNVNDIKEALSGTKLSGAYQEALTSGSGIDQLYRNITDYLSTNRTAEEIAKAKADFKVSDADIAAAKKYAEEQRKASAPNIENTVQKLLEERRVSEAAAAEAAAKAAEESQRSKDAASNDEAKSGSLDTGNDIYKYFADPATQAALAAGDTRSIAETMQSLGWSPAEVAAATGTSEADVQAAYDAALATTNKADSTDTYQPYYDDTDYGYMQFAEGGMAKGRYLQGGTDGMADEIPAQIGRDQPAALSHGEFVVPADVVSHLGNGNSDAGAKKLYQMMDKIRMARTGNKKQGKRINPDKFMPGGLAAAYAAGGAVKKFAGETSSMVTANNQYNQGIAGTESNLSNWGGPYVTNMLGQGQALANMPYQSYMGQLTAGQSPLQTQAFTAASGLTTPTSIGDAATTAGAIGTTAQGLSYTPTTFGNQYTAPTAYTPTTSSFDATQAATYMNPYLKASLEPQIEEARRQSQITQQQNAAKMTGAGAFGGSRQAIMDAETQRNLGSNLANITGQGYNTAYTNAMSQFNADQARKAQEAQFGAQQGMTSAQLGAQYGLAGQQAGEQSKQFGVNYGLQGLQTGLQAAQTQGALGTQENQAGLNNLNALLTAGGQQRGIESEGIAADKAQFEEARANPYKMVQFQQSLLQGLPLSAQSYQGIAPSALTKAAQGATTVDSLLRNLGLIT